jgi:hypothetical protein
MDSALGVIGARPKSQTEFLGHIDWFEDYLGEYPPPQYPFPIDQAKAAAGKSVFDKTCASCHASERTGTLVPISEVGTDRKRLDTWSKDAAIKGNQVVRGFGLGRKGLVEEPLIAMSHPFWTESGSARRICTMEPWRRCTICWSRSTNDPRSSSAATTSITQSMEVP